MELVLLPDIINEKEEYEVEEVQNHRKQGCNMQFLVYLRSLDYYDPKLSSGCNLGKGLSKRRRNV